MSLDFSSIFSFRIYSLKKKKLDRSVLALLENIYFVAIKIVLCVCLSVQQYMGVSFTC